MRLTGRLTSTAGVARTDSNELDQLDAELALPQTTTAAKQHARQQVHSDSIMSA